MFFTLRRPRVSRNIVRKILHSINDQKSKNIVQYQPITSKEKHVQSKFLTQTFGDDCIQVWSDEKNYLHLSVIFY